ncbi:MAG: CpaF family protein [bacterium]
MLRRRLSKIDRPATPGEGSPDAPLGHTDDHYHEVKGDIHAKLVENLDFASLESLSNEELQGEIHEAITQLIRTEDVPLNHSEREVLVEEVLHEVLGYGPLEHLLKDYSITDILVNNYNSVYIERKGILEKTNIRFKNNEHLLHIIHRIVAAVGRRIDDSSPMVDARLPDGSRVNAIIPPLALDGPCLSIRRFGSIPLKFEDLIRFQSILPEMVEFLTGCVKAKLNILISGGTGSGKTTLLNVLSSFIPEGERIVTIEDSAELQLQQPHVVRLETRPPNIEGKGEVTQRDLVKNTLRMRPDRIVIGEVRGGEALDMLQAMNTGHEGSLTTIHANTTRDALMRLETMVAMAGLDLPDKAIRQQVSSAIDIMIQANRLPDGKRKIVQIAELTGMEGETVTTQDIFIFDQQGVDGNGNVFGVFRATGIRPSCVERMEAYGVRLPEGIFTVHREVPGL